MKRSYFSADDANAMSTRRAAEAPVQPAVPVAEDARDERPDEPRRARQPRLEGHAVGHDAALAVGLPRALVLPQPLQQRRRALEEPAVADLVEAQEVRVERQHAAGQQVARVLVHAE